METRNLRIVARYLSKTGTEFPTEEALAKYLKEHPDADKSKHTVKKPEKEEKSDGGERKPAEHRQLGEEGRSWVRQLGVPKGSEEDCINGLNSAKSREEAAKVLKYQGVEREKIPGAIDKLWKAK